MSVSICRSVVQPIARRLTDSGSGIGSSITYLSRLLTGSTTTPFYAGTTNIVDISSTGDYREIQPGRCLVGDGSTQYITVGDIAANVRSISFWVKPEDITSHTDGVLRLASGKTVTIVNGTVTLTGVSGDIRVNDVDTAVVGGIDQWFYVSIVLSADHDADAVVLMQDGTTELDGGLSVVLFYSDELTDAEITALYRQGLQPDAIVEGQPDATNLVGRWLLDDASETTAYDSSGNGNHGTIVGYASGMLYEGSDVPYSQQNLVGYSEGASSTFVPRDESDPANDVLGNPLQYTGTVPKYATPVDAPGLTWDGSTQLLPVAGLSGSETVVRSGGTSTPSISAGQIDFTAGTCWDLLLSNGMYFPLSEGDGNTVYDVVNGDSYTITGYASTMWDNTQDQFFYSFENGCRESSGVAIPALADGSAAADGDPLTGLPGLLNSDSYDLNLLSESDAPYQRSAIPGATFDGVGDYISFPEIDIRNGAEIEFTYYYESGVETLIGHDRWNPVSTDDTSISILNENGIRVKRRSPQVDFEGLPNLTGWHVYRFVFTATDVSLYLDGVFEETLSVGFENEQSLDLIGVKTNAIDGSLVNPASGVFAAFKILDHFEYDFRENNGLIIPDRSGNGNDGTLVVNSSLAQIFAPTALETAYTIGDGRTRPHYVTVDSPNETDFRTEII
jgi:hypothetical protein